MTQPTWCRHSKALVPGPGEVTTDLTSAHTAWGWGLAGMSRGLRNQQLGAASSQPWTPLIPMYPTASSLYLRLHFLENHQLKPGLLPDIWQRMKTSERGPDWAEIPIRLKDRPKSQKTGSRAQSGEDKLGPKQGWPTPGPTFLPRIPQSTLGKQLFQLFG